MNVPIEICVAVVLFAVFSAAFGIVARYRYHQARQLSAWGYKAKEFPWRDEWKWTCPENERCFEIHDAYKRGRLMAERKRLNIPEDPKHSYKPGAYLNSD